MDLVVVGSVLELRDSSDPSLCWPARVVQNVGGRLRLRLAGLSQEHQDRDSWLFYLDVRLRPLGWALENKLALEPPTGDLACVCLCPWGQNVKLGLESQSNIDIYRKNLSFSSI